MPHPAAPSARPRARASRDAARRSDRPAGSRTLRRPYEDQERTDDERERRDHTPSGRETGYRSTVYRGMGGHRGKGPQNWKRPDERIHETVNEVLTDHDHIDATHIEVTVVDG